MTMPGGFEIAEGYVTIRAKVDKAQISKTAQEAGAEAGSASGETYTRKFTERIRDSRGRFVSAGAEVGEHFGDGFHKRSTSRFGGLFSNLIKDGLKTGMSFAQNFSKTAGDAMEALGPQLKGILIAGAATAAPLIGASIGGAITAVLGGGLLAAGVAVAMKHPDVEMAGKEFRNKIFGMTEEDRKKLNKDLENAENRMERYKLNLAKASTPQAKKNALVDIEDQKGAIKEIKKEIDEADNFLFARATKVLRGPLIQGFEAATKFFERLEPTFTRLFKEVTPGLGILGKGLGDMLTGFLPGFEKLMQNMTPFFKVLGDGFQRIGTALGNMLNRWASDPKVLSGFIMALETLFGLTVSLINIFGSLVATWSRIFAEAKVGWGRVANWFTGTIVPSFSKALSSIKGAFQGLINWFAGPFKNFFVSIWNSVSSFFRNTWTSIKNTAVNTATTIKDAVSSRFSILKSGISSAVSGIKGFFQSLWDKASTIFTNMGNKINSFKNGAINSFKLAKDGISKVWSQVQDVAKKPVNFVIDPVYKNLANLWNKVAGTVGIKTTLPEIKKFATGGIAPGVGNKDTVPAMLTPGEGILTKSEMKKIGGARGFANLRKEIQYFSDGGIVGGIKNWVSGKINKGKEFVGGLFRGAIYPGAKALADKFIYPLINSMDNTGFSSLARGGANKIVSSVLDWFKKDDSANSGMIGGGGGSAMGWKKQIAVLRQQFPGLALLSGFRPGATTLSGNRSYHSKGRAVDVPARRDVAQWINSRFGKTTKELISPWNDLNIHNGRRHTYTGDIYAQHAGTGRFKGNAHDHWAMDGISQRSPGWFAGYNGTGKTETLVNADKIPDVLKPVQNTFAPGSVVISVRNDDDIEEIKQFFAGMRTGYNSGLA